MAAVFVPAARPELPHHLILPSSPRATDASLEDLCHGLGNHPPPGAVVLVAGAWRLTLPELRQLTRQLADRGLSLCRVEGGAPDTRVAAAALGLATPPLPPPQMPMAAGAGGAAKPGDGLLIHRGTLRSGDHLQVEGSVLLLGDVNPGARVSATGHVLVWGRLRGVAHAGCAGDLEARIVALQLRPLQLRIASVVARGPEDGPPPGFAEQARLLDGMIRIDPAPPSWPLQTGERQSCLPAG